jgi:hypothetical protein
MCVDAVPHMARGAYCTFNFREGRKRDKFPLSKLL